MANTRKKYTREFMDSAVRMVLDGDKSVAEVGRELGIPDWKVGGWVRAAKKSGTASGSAAGSNVEQELKRLQREHKRLLEEHEILKKAAAFFAQHQK